MSERKLKITIHPDIVQICIIFFHNKNFDFNCEKKDSVTLVSENALLKDQKKYMFESISNLENTNTIHSPFDNNLNCAVTSLFLSNGNNTDHKISLFSQYLSKFIEESEIQISESRIVFFLQDLISNIFKSDGDTLFEKYPILKKLFTTNEDILFLLHAKAIFNEFLESFLICENEVYLPNDFIKALLSQLPKINLELYDEHSINEFRKNHTTKHSKINKITRIQKSNTARKNALIKAENERNQKENLRLLTIEAYENKIGTKEWHGFQHFYKTFTMKQNIKIKDTNSNLSEIELDKLLVKEGTIRKILKKYRDSKK